MTRSVCAAVAYPHIQSHDSVIGMRFTSHLAALVVSTGLGTLPGCEQQRPQMQSDTGTLDAVAERDGGQRDEARSEDAASDRGSAPDASLARDSARGDGPPVACTRGGDLVFPVALYEGVWLCGWSGGLDHYSWFIFDPDETCTAGTFTVLDAECISCIGYWDCTGSGTFVVSLEENYLLLNNPTGCSRSMGSLHPMNFSARASHHPQDVTASMWVRTNGGDALIECLRYPRGRCNPERTVCQGSP